MEREYRKRTLEQFEKERLFRQRDCRERKVEQTAFSQMHLLRSGFGFVFAAQEVQYPMNSQERQFLFHSHLMLIGLPVCRINRNNHVAKYYGFSRNQRERWSAFHVFDLRERENIGRFIVAPVTPV